MPTFFDAPSKDWTYEAIAVIYGAEDNNISRILDNIKKDLQRRASGKDRDAVQAQKLLNSGWKVSKASRSNGIQSFTLRISSVPLGVVVSSWVTPCRPVMTPP